MLHVCSAAELLNVHLLFVETHCSGANLFIAYCPQHAYLLKIVSTERYCACVCSMRVCLHKFVCVHAHACVYVHLIVLACIRVHFHFFFSY